MTVQRIKYYLKLLLPLVVLFFSPYIKCQKVLKSQQAGQPIPLTFKSQGDLIHGLFYKVPGNGVFSTVILCPGFPGSGTDVLGLGSGLMQEGINALVFNYRGTWGSGGTLTIPNSLEDIASAIRYAKSDFAVRTFNIDTSNIAIIGYSFGGGIALLGSLRDTTVERVVDIAGGDLSEVARMMQADADYKRDVEDLLEEGISSSGFNSLNAKDMFTDVLMDMDKYDLVKHAEQLSHKNILFISGWSDQVNIMERHILPLFRALQKHGARQLEIEVFSTDHSFKNVRDQLMQTILAWLKKD
jgi:pimeloyl-ACP methyl ester carboxylesterase